MPKKKEYINGYEVAFKWTELTSFEIRCWLELIESLQNILMSYSDKEYWSTKMIVEGAIRRVMNTHKQFNYLATVKATPPERGKVWKVEVWRNLQTVGENSTESEKLWLTIVNVMQRNKAANEALQMVTEQIEYGPGKEVHNG